jgi:hypothetical protein
MFGDDPYASLIPPRGRVAPIEGAPPAPEKPKDAPSGYRWTEGGGLAPIPGGPADPKSKGDGGDPKSTESERTAAFLATNLYGGVSQLKAAIAADPTAAAPSVKSSIAGIFGSTARNFANSPARQQAEAAQLLILDNALTLGTGAAYTREQLEGYRQSYFPQLGDDETTIAAKQKNLRTLMLGARIKAGSQAGQIDEAMQALGLSPQIDNGGASLVPAGSAEDPGPKGVRWTPQQLADVQGFIKANPDATPEEAAAWLKNSGIPGELPRSNWEEILAAARKGKISDRADYTLADAQAREAARANLEEQNKALPGGGASDAGTLLANGASLGLSDEAAGLANALTTFNDGSLAENYRLGRDTERLRQSDARQRLGWGGTAIEIGGGLLAGNPNAVLAPATGALNTTLRGARVGAEAGALAGFGSGDGAVDSFNKGALGAVLGGGIGGGISALSTRVSARGRAPDLAAAAEAENVRLNRPMFDPKARDRLAALEAQPGSAPIVQRAIANTADDIEAGVTRLSGGQALDTEAAGGAIQGAARNFIQRSRGVADRLYNRARSLAGDTRVDPTNAVAQLDQELTALRANPETNAGEISMLEGLRSDLTTAGGKSVSELRDLRTSIRGRINEKNLTATQAEARAMRVLDAVHDDLRSLPNGAAGAFRRADTYYRERMTHIDDVTSRFLGPKDKALSGEEAFSRLKRMTSPNGDGRRLASMWRDLAPSEQSDVAATIAQSLGRRDPDAPFSTALFVSQVAKLSPSARRTIFGPGGADSIGNLVTLSRSLENATSRLNRSNTARSFWQDSGRTLATALTLGPLTGAGTGSVTTGATVAAVPIAASIIRTGQRALSARALMSPRVSRWLAELPNIASQGQAQSHVQRLGTIMAREPALSGELQPLQRWLSESFGRGGPALAEPQEGQRNEQ